MRRLFRQFRQPGVSPPLAETAFAPLVQAQRCLDAWLEEEGRRLTVRQKSRAGALIARYFAHEDDVSDHLILSFLRHYAGMGAVDLEDPQAVRLELKAVLDRSTAALPPAHSGRARLLLAAVTGMAAMASVLAVLYLSQQTLSVEEQQELRAVVAMQADVRGVPPASVWAEVKRALGVTRYQDIRRWDFDRALDIAKK